MNILRKLTVKILWKNRTRTLVTVVGVILSASMICAVTTFASSLQQMLLNETIYSEGNYYARSEGVTAETVRKIASDRRVSRLTAAQEIGYAMLEGGTNAYKPYLYLMGVGESFFESLPIRLLEGRLPENPGEVLIPKHVESNGGVDYEPGQELTLRIGYRTAGDETELGQEDALRCDEEDRSLESLEITQERTVTVVGIYARPSIESFSAPGYTVLTVMDREAEESISGEAAGDPSARYTVYIKTGRPGNIGKVGKDYRLELTENRRVLLASGDIVQSSYAALISGFAAAVIAIIMVGSVSLIYNAFSISVSERTRQYGLLASVGATKKQLRRSVLFEALAVSAVGIPVGILCGIGGIGITLGLLGGMIREMFELSAALTLHVSWLSVAAAAVISLVTVLLSAWVPAGRAMRISPIEAIRQTGDIRVRAREVRISPLVEKLFGVEGMIGAKYFRRNRKSYRATVVSLAVSITLFISASSLSGYMRAAFGGRAQDSLVEFQLSVYVHAEHTPEEIAGTKEQILALTGAERVTELYASGSAAYAKIPADAVSDRMREYLLRRNGGEGDPIGEDGMRCAVGLCFLSDGEYMEFAAEEKIDTQALLSGEVPMAIAYSRHTWSADDRHYERFDVLKEITPDSAVPLGEIEWYWPGGGEEEDEVPETVVGARAESLPFSLAENELSQITLIYPMSAFTRVMGRNLEDGHVPMLYRVRCGDHRAAEKALEQLPNADVYDDAAERENGRNLLLVTNVFAYGFVILISLIAVTNVFNTISTNVLLRRREFAMLKSMGMSARGLQRMMNYECILYGARALLFGLPLSAAVTYWIYRITERSWDTAFFLPPKAVALAVFSVFLIVFITMLYAMSQVRRENPIDALRSELQ